MAEESPSSVQINGKELKPAPFVSTSYDYRKSGQYVIGGFLNVTLNGTLADENIADRMREISELQSGFNCVNLIVGCQGNTDFLNGSGKISSVEVSPGDQPFVASYTIVIAIETIGGQPAVEPDPDFLTANCLTKEEAKYILSYSENLSVSGGDNVILVDSELNVSKSFIKGSGSINLVIYGSAVCDDPSFDGVQQAINILNKRASQLMSFTFCGNQTHPLSKYSGWNKHLDTKTLKIDDTGAVEWTFDLYMTNGGCTPIAWVDINTDSRIEYQSGPDEKKTKNISGTIRGLSQKTNGSVDNKSGSGERMSNARSALGVVLPEVISGEWPNPDHGISGTRGTPPEEPDSECQPENKVCYQRISSNISMSTVAGEISFSAEFADINACQPKGNSIIDVSIEESLPVLRYVEFIVPNIGNSIVQIMGDTPHEATVTVRGALQGCDKEKIETTIECVDKQFEKSIRKYNGWLIRNDTKTISTYNYSKTRSFIKCE